MTGKVYLVGAGPGAPDLLTLRAVNLLKAADIVFYDALVHPDTVALADHAVKIPVGKRCGQHSATQATINSELIKAAQHHTHIVRLKGGDPLVFGRAQEEIDALDEAGIEIEVVPGVTAALAAAAELGVSLTRRGLARSLTLLTPKVGDYEQESRWRQCARYSDTLAIYMARDEARQVAKALLEEGLSPDTPVVITVNASRIEDHEELHMTLIQLSKAEDLRSTAPALILVGDVFR